MARPRDPGALIPIVALFLLAGVDCGIHEEDVEHSFDLVGAHADLSCSDCHGDDLDEGDELGALPPTNCLGCHEADRPAPHWDDECDECHGQEVWDDQEFEHEDYELTGAHLELECGACHEVAWEAELSCLACHDEDRPHGHIEHECVFCHTTEAWEDLHWHHEEFPLLGGHSHLVCSACHVDGYFGSDMPDTACVSCHEEDTPPDHDPRPCEVCHNIYDWDDVTEPD